MWYQAWTSLFSNPSRGTALPGPQEMYSCRVGEPCGMFRIHASQANCWGATFDQGGVKSTIGIATRTHAARCADDVLLTALVYDPSACGIKNTSKRKVKISPCLPRYCGVDKARGGAAVLCVPGLHRGAFSRTALLFLTGQARRSHPWRCPRGLVD